MIRQLVQLIVVFLIQVLVINNLDLSGYINPYIYPLIILSLPLKTTRIPLMLYSFALGLVMDLFCNTSGMHAAAMLLLGYMRPVIYQSLSPRSNMNMEEMLNIKNMGFTSFLYYTLILVFVHHFLYFFLEVFSFNQFFRTLLKIVLSTLFSSMLIIITAILFAPIKRRN